MGNIFMPLTLDVWLLTILLVTFCGLVVWAMEDRASLSRARTHPSRARAPAFTNPTHLVTGPDRICRKTCSLQLPASIADGHSDTHFAGKRPCRPHPGRKSS